MYNAFQKFYSALSALEQFDKENDFFDNISSLDKFFSEFRAITFVIQKSVAHTKNKEIYEKYRDMYLCDCKWFVEKRNEVTKEHAFHLVKEIIITIYYPYGGTIISRECFTVEDDMAISDILDKIKALLVRNNESEVFFSAEFNFYEKDSREDLYDKLIAGITAMQDFLLAMQGEIEEDGFLCEKVTKKISELKFLSLPKDFLFIIDYVFYPRSDTFEKASRMAMMLGKGKMPRVPLLNLNNGIYSKFGQNNFDKFIIMNVAIKTTDLMPTIWTIYEDNTMEIDVFHADIKTTIYRKINELANNILTSDIREVYCMMTYTLCDIDSVAPNMTSSDRMEIGVEECLAFFMVDKYLNEKECTLLGSKLEDISYVGKKVFGERSSELDIGKVNMIPVIEAFKTKAQHRSAPTVNNM